MHLKLTISSFLVGVEIMREFLKIAPKINFPGPLSINNLVE